MPRQAREPDPVSLIEHFGAELSALRNAEGLSRPQLAERLGCTAQWVGQIELATSTPSEPFALDLDTYYKTGGTFHRLWKSIQRATRRRVLLPGFPRYLELEAKAVLVRAFVTQLVPGLLQTEAYTRATMDPALPPAVVEERVAARVDRQAILRKEKPPRALFVLDEAVLHRRMGGNEVMAEQLRHLVELAEVPHIEVRVLPFSAVTPAGLDGKFTLLRLRDGDECLYQEGPGFSQVIDETDIIADCTVRFDLVMGEALSRDESVKLILKVLEDLT